MSTPLPSNPVADEVRAAFRHELTQMAHGSTHYEDCWKDHWACVLNKLVEEIDRLTHEKSPVETSGEQCDSCDPDHGAWRCEKPQGHDGPHEVHGETAYVSWAPEKGKPPPKASEQQP